MRTSTVSSALVSCSVLVATAACGGANERAYIERLGSDTMAVEVYTRSASGFEGQLLTRSPVTRVASYTGTLSSEGTISRLEVDFQTPEENPEGPGPEHWSITIEGDSATVERTANGESSTTRVEAPAGLIPQIGRAPWSYAIVEQAVKQAIASGSDSYPVQLMSGSRPQPSPNTITRVDSETVSWGFFGMPMTAQVDAEGKVLALSGSQTTMAVEGEAVTGIDLASMASEFAARDARGEGLGVPSPPASVDVTIGRAHLTVDYSQPAKRGREIWGGLVPHDAVWRTGANSATVFTTDRNLTIRGTRIPAGSYSLWTTFTASSATLIINSQTGQWGTAYDSSQDFARIMMDSEEIGEGVERFTIAIEPADGGATMQLSWDQTRYSVPIAIR